MSLLDPVLLPRLVGVIDLKDGLPVHAIAGQRESYRPIQLRRAGQLFETDNRGEVISAAGFVDAYRRLGIRQFYVADLDGLAGRTAQWNLLERLISRLDESDDVWVDAGWRGDESADVRRRYQKLASLHSRLRWVVASESAARLAAVTPLATILDPKRIWLGMDYRDHVWLAAQADEADWVEHAVAAGLGGAVVLDVATVGTSSGPGTLPIVQRVRRLAPGWPIISGGGVRDHSDAEKLLHAGCAACLVATAVFPWMEDQP